MQSATAFAVWHLQASASNRGASRPPLLRPGLPGQGQGPDGLAADEDDSGTDTDEDGNLIAQARAARDAALQKKAAPKRRAPTGES